MPRLKESLPQGRTLPAETWRARHRGILWLLAAHAGGLAIFGLLVGADPVHALVEGGILAVIALVAAAPALSQRARSVVAGFGLMSSSAILTHLSGGYVEAHFHFFVMLGIIFLYEDWVPFLLAIAYVAVHHGIAGTLDPSSVFNHPDAIAHPWRWALIHAAFILGLSAALIVTWNVTERSRRAEMRAQSEARGLRRELGAQEKMAALGSLVSGLAHEVRTPLTIVSSNASVIALRASKLEGPDAERARAQLMASVTEIQSSVDRMNGLVKQLKRFVRLEEQSQEILCLEPLVEEAIRLFRAANPAGPDVEVQLEATSPAALSALGVQQIVINLLSNAAEAIDPENGHVRVMTFDRNGYACLVVEDDGHGMTEEVRGRVFEPLFTTKSDGMGLGLSIVRKIAERHRATIECDSAPGRGAKFTIAFPTAKVVPVDAGAPELAARAS